MTIDPRDALNAAYEENATLVACIAGLEAENERLRGAVDAAKEAVRNAFSDICDEESDRAVDWNVEKSKLGDSTRPKSEESIYLFGRMQALLAVDEKCRAIDLSQIGGKP